MKRVLSSMLSIAALSCGGRPAIWDAPASSKVTVAGLSTAAVLVDDDQHRALRVTPDSAGLQIATSKVGHNVVKTVATEDGGRVFVLSNGDTPRKTATDEGPSLTVFERAGSSTRYELPSPMSDLSIDPAGDWVAVHAGSHEAGAYVRNENEVTLVSLKQPPSANNPTTLSLASFGGSPQQFFFTPEMAIPSRAANVAPLRRLLVVARQSDVALVDLSHAQEPSYGAVTVPFTGEGDNRRLTPTGIAVDEARPDIPDIGIRVKNDSNVFILTLGPASAAESVNDFLPSMNLADVGGEATDLAFVQTGTPGGEHRLAALVPSKKKAVLIDPRTTLAPAVDLPAGYRQMSLLRRSTGGASAASVALLWGGEGGASFWSLTTTEATPYRAIRELNVDEKVSSVSDLPGRPSLKLLRTSGTYPIHVLDLDDGTAQPLTAVDEGLAFRISPDGQRAWVYQPGTNKLSRVDMSSLRKLHADDLFVDRPITDLFEVTPPGGQPTLLVFHDAGNFGTTVFDALSPDPAKSRISAGLLINAFQEGQ